jgi:sRNA-binding protein
MLGELDCFEIGSPGHTSQGTAMAKARKRRATRKKASKRGKASARPARKKASKRATPKKRVPKTAAKMAPRRAPRQSVPVIEDTIIDVVDEPIPGVVRVTEYETIRTTTHKRAAGPETEE